MLKDDVATFTAHLSVTIKRLKSSFGRHVGGHTLALQHGGQILLQIILLC